MSRRVEGLGAGPLFSVRLPGHPGPSPVGAAQPPAQPSPTAVTSISLFFVRVREDGEQSPEECVGRADPSEGSKEEDEEDSLVSNPTSADRPPAHRPSPPSDSSDEEDSDEETPLAEAGGRKGVAEEVLVVGTSEGRLETLSLRSRRPLGTRHSPPIATAPVWSLHPLILPFHLSQGSRVRLVVGASVRSGETSLWELSFPGSSLSLPSAASAVNNNRTIITVVQPEGSLGKVDVALRGVGRVRTGNSAFARTALVQPSPTLPLALLVSPTSDPGIVGCWALEWSEIGGELADARESALTLLAPASSEGMCFALQLAPLPTASANHQAQVWAGYESGRLVAWTVASEGPWGAGRVSTAMLLSLPAFSSPLLSLQLTHMGGLVAGDVGGGLVWIPPATTPTPSEPTLVRLVASLPTDEGEAGTKVGVQDMALRADGKVLALAQWNHRHPSCFAFSLRPRLAGMIAFCKLVVLRAHTAINRVYFCTWDQKNLVIGLGGDGKITVWSAY